MSNSQSSKAEQGMEKYFFRASAADFKKVPGSPISYWISKNWLQSRIERSSKKYKPQVVPVYERRDVSALVWQL